MHKGKDIFWRHAQLKEDGKLACNFCGEQYTGGITRFKYHLAGLLCHDVAICHQVPDNVKQMALKAFEGMNEKPTKKGKMSSYRISSSASGPHLGSSGSTSNSLTKEGGQLQTISNMFRKQEKDNIDRLLFKAMVMNNLPFNLLRSNDFKNFVVVVSQHGPGYFPPSSETARKRLLDDARKEVDVYIEEMKSTWEHYGCTIMSDIWKDTIRSRSYINLLVSCPTGTIFWKAKHVEKVPKNAELITEFLSSAIEEIGPKNVIQIVTDNGSNYRKAKLILEERYSNIFTTSCAAHCIDLMLEDIDTLENVASIMTKARQIVKFIYNKQQALDVMRTYTKGAELKRPGATRFASHFICLHSILKQEENLRFMVASNDWRLVEEVEKDHARDITHLIQNEDFWNMGKEIIMFVEPLVKVLKMVDGEGSTMGYLYEALDRAKEAIKAASKDKKEKYMSY
uniref:BED-type domain-containing protein n=2 Tax=Nymphaea colorata TaxID=210225 RepID=A0A5K0ZHH5_9MAGN